MSKYIAFLRAVNVGGRVVKMEQLKKIFEDLKLKNVKTFIQSGNVIFETMEKDKNILTKKIEKKLKASLNYEVLVIHLRMTNSMKTREFILHFCIINRAKKQKIFFHL